MRTLACLFLLLSPVLAFAADPGVTQKIDALYEKRDDAAAVKELEATLDAALKANPNDYAILWRASRYKYWVADGLPAGDAQKRAGKEGWDLAERAIKQNPNAVEGHYYAAINIGAYSEAVGILNALGEGLEGKFNARLDLAIKLDPSFDHAGPLITKGRYFEELPWPMRNLGKSTQMLQKAVEKNPESLRAYLYLAETLLHDGKTQKAKETLAKALTGSVAYDGPEGRRVHKMAKDLQDREKDLR